MKKLKTLTIRGALTFSLIVIFVLTFDSTSQSTEEHREHGEGEHHDEPPRGPKGGRVLSQGDFSLEVTIFEKGVPPQFRVYAYKNEKLVDPGRVSVTIELRRFGGVKELFELKPESEYLTTEKTVEEPHSFDVSIRSSYDGKTNSWEYDSYEGRTELSEAALKAAEIGIESAGPQRIEQVVTVFGKLAPSEDSVAHIHPRFGGVIREVRKKLGEMVLRGDVLAVVENNQNLQPYDVRSAIAGMVIKRHAALGEFVSDERELFVVADLSELFAEFQVYRDDFGQTKVGQKVAVRFDDELPPIISALSYISPLTDESTQSKLVRAIIPNPDLRLRPGLFITGELTVLDTPVAVAIKRTAIQTFRDWDVVFLTDSHVFQAIPVSLGRRDSEWVEITAGVEAGQQYVSKNSFIIKADIEKSGASHDH